MLRLKSPSMNGSGAAPPRDVVPGNGDSENGASENGETQAGAAVGGHAPTSIPTGTSVPLLRRFCEELVAEAVARVREELPGAEPPEIDWQRLWDARPGTSPASAAGHAVVEAQRIASEVLQWKQTMVGAHGTLNGSPPPAAAEAL